MKNWSLLDGRLDKAICNLFWWLDKIDIVNHILIINMYICLLIIMLLGVLTWYYLTDCSDRCSFCAYSWQTGCNLLQGFLGYRIAVWKYDKFLFLSWDFNISFINVLLKSNIIISYIYFYCTYVLLTNRTIKNI